ncbi:MFS transporter [Microbacterium sp. ZW T5_45]|uniref:MFS transporter n=1 Tax=Microbacterium sp. ZW T5_45 TaxID=3378080 RepID=UPI003852541D
MGAPTATPPTVLARPRTRAVAGSFLLQGAGYAVVVTSLPSFQTRLAVDTATVSLVLLGVCVTAGLGSAVADLLAIRGNSRQAVTVGFMTQAVSLIVVLSSTSPMAFVAGALIYGIGLGIIDAASNMQAVLVQRGAVAPLLGRFYAAYTAGAILGAVAMSAALAADIGAVAALAAVSALQFVFVILAVRRLDPARAAHARRQPRAQRLPLPGRAIVMTGLVVLAAFAIDSAVSSWSTVHLSTLGATAGLAPLGYAAYQACVLGARLAADVLVDRLGTPIVMAAAILAGALGGLVVAFLSGPVAAITGFALSGLAVGALVPIAFTKAGLIEPSRSDEVIARVNLFNYAGAVFGAVGVGLMMDVPGASLAFLLPVVLLIAALPALSAARR